MKKIIRHYGVQERLNPEGVWPVTRNEKTVTEVVNGEEELVEYYYARAVDSNNYQMVMMVVNPPPKPVPKPPELTLIQKLKKWWKRK